MFIFHTEQENYRFYWNMVTKDFIGVLFLSLIITCEDFFFLFYLYVELYNIIIYRYILQMACLDNNTTQFLE